MNKEERTEIRNKDRDILKNVARDGEEIVARQMDEIQKKYKKIEARIKELKEQKSEFLSGAVTKAEILETAKERLRSGKKSFIQQLLGEHLKQCQAANVLPFVNMHLKMRMLDPDQAWKLFFFAVTEKDVEEAVALLPDIGISASAREAEIKKIDREISRLSKVIKDDLEALKA